MRWARDLVRVMEVEGGGVHGVTLISLLNTTGMTNLMINSYLWLCAIISIKQYRGADKSLDELVILT